MTCKYSIPPGPKTVPGFGNLFNVRLDTLQHSLWHHREKFGDISSFELGGKTFVVLNSMEAIREALECDETACVVADRPDTFFQRFVMGDGISLASYSETWNTLRSATHDFMKTVNESWFEAQICEEITYLKDMYRLSSNDSTPVNLSASIQKFVANYVVTFMTGNRLEYDHDIHISLNVYLENAAKLFRPKPLSMLTKFPFLRHLPWPYGKAFKTMSEAKDTMIQYLIYNRKQHAQDSPKEQNGFVHHMFEAQKTNAQITDERIGCVLQDMFTAGVPGLTSSLLSLFHQLAHNPDVQNKIYDEIATVVGTDRDPSIADRPRLPYTQAVIFESMRLASVVPGSVPRVNSKEVTVCGHTLPKGTIFVTNIWKVHHDGQVYEQPWVFRPDRYLTQDGSLVCPDHPSRRHLVPYGVGVRRCVGQSLAASAMFRYVTSVYRNFSFRATDSETDCDPRRYTRDILMYPPPHTVIVTPRVPIHEQQEITI